MTIHSATALDAQLLNPVDELRAPSRFQGTGYGVSIDTESILKENHDEMYSDYVKRVIPYVSGNRDNNP